MVLGPQGLFKQDGSRFVVPQGLFQADGSRLWAPKACLSQTVRSFWPQGLFEPNSNEELARLRGCEKEFEREFDPFEREFEEVFDPFEKD